MAQSKKLSAQVEGIKALRKLYEADFHEANPSKKVQEAFQSKVMKKEITFPKELGEKHPFDFESVEKVFKKTGIVSGAVNKYVDAIVGDFSVKVEDENGQAILDEFIKTTNFPTVIREWLIEAVSKGNGFMELDFEDAKAQVLNAKHIFIKRDKDGMIEKYNQFFGNVEKFSANKQEINPIDPERIAHLKINAIAGEPYAIGKIWPNERTIENIVLGEQALHKLIDRKAGAPIHVQVGQPGEFVDPAAVQEFKNLLQFMNTRTEWVTDGNVTITPLQIGDLGRGLFEALQHDIRMLAAGTEIPEVLFGSGQLNEGIALVQDKGFDRKIKSIRENAEAVLEENIFKPLLRNNFGEQEGRRALDFAVEFSWNLPDEEEINKRIEKISTLLGTQGISNVMRAFLELELAKLLDIEGAEDLLKKPADAQKEDAEAENGEPGDPERETEEESIRQPEVPGAKPNATAQSLTEKSSQEMTIEEFVNLQEFKGFTYTDYLIEILELLNKDKFDDLRALTQEDVTNGLFTEAEINDLRTILKEGFRQNQTIRDIEGRIIQDMQLRDRMMDGKIKMAALARANAIARTETVRVANKALVSLYNQNNIDRYRFLAALSDRTCPICEGLNGQVFPIKEAVAGANLPPMHTACRCSTVAIVE